MPKFAKTRDRYRLNSAKKKKCKATLKVFFKNVEKSKAAEDFNTLISMIDKLAKHHIIHANKAGRLKSKCYSFLNSLS